MRRIFTLVAAIGLLSTSACSTKYQEIGATGGVSAFPIANDTYRITARGNGYTDQSLIQDFVLLKSAEVALSKNANFFRIVKSQDASRSHTQFKSRHYSSFSSGSAYTVLKPGSDVYIQILRVPKGQKPPSYVFNAREVYNSIAPRLKEKPKK
ncbi:MAG: hypothetical protein ABJM29_07135 [Rhizobiaceae bacterium]